MRIKFTLMHQLIAIAIFAVVLAAALPIVRAARLAAEKAETERLYRESGILRPDALGHRPRID